MNGDIQLQASTIASLDSSAARGTLHFTSQNTEDDFVRFWHGTKHGPLVMGVLSAMFAVAYVLFYVTTGPHGELLTVLFFVPIGILLFAAVALLFVGVAERDYKADPSRIQDMAQALWFARAAEAIPSVALALLIAWAELSWPWNVDAWCAGRDGDDALRCYSRASFSLIYVMFNAVVATPRFVPWTAAIGVLAVVCKLAAEFIAASRVSPLTAIDRVASTMVHIGVVVAFTIVAVKLETGARAHFLSVVWQQRARRQIEVHATTVRAMLRSALPEQLLDTALLPEAQNVAHSSQRAACVIADIHAFARWSTGLLVSSVVEVLHLLVAEFDAGITDHPDVMRAAAYGDSYVVACGLIATVEVPAVAAMHFAEWQLQAAAGVAYGMRRPFATRISVACGALVGAVIGDTSKRYTVAGEALRLAETSIRSCAPNSIVVAETETADPDRPSAVVTHRMIAAGPSTLSAQPSIATAETPEVPYNLSAVWLSYDNPDQQKAFVAFTETRDTAPVAVALLALFGSLLAVAVLERAMGQVRDNTAVILAAAVVLSALDLAQRRCACLARIPLPATVLLMFAVLATATTALFLSTSRFTWADPQWIVIAWMDLLPRAPWMLRTAVVMTAPVLPLLYVRFTMDSLALAIFIALTSIVITGLQCYGLSRALCVHFVATAVAADAVSNAEQCAAHQGATLVGLLPPHALPHAHSSIPGVSTFVDMWDQLSVLQLRLSSASTAVHRLGVGDDVRALLRPISRSWQLMHELVDASEGQLLELVEATGDTFLVAGPFHDRRDETFHAASHAVVELLRDLSTECSRPEVPLTITAVATAGSACGALGPSKLTYRMFGAAIRESTALLEAAPRMPAPPAQCCVRVGGVSQTVRPCRDGGTHGASRHHARHVDRSTLAGRVSGQCRRTCGGRHSRLPRPVPVARRRRRSDDGELRKIHVNQRFPRYPVNSKHCVFR
jgi:class 3 adenylate cyclase